MEGKRKRAEVSYKEINPFAWTGLRFKNTDFLMETAARMEIQEEDGSMRVGAVVFFYDFYYVIPPFFVGAGSVVLLCNYW